MRMIAHVGNQLPVVPSLLVVVPSLLVVVPSLLSAFDSVEFVQHPGSHGNCASPSWNAHIMFGPDSTPVATVNPGVTCV
jgi:hypothetical protein